MLSQTSPVHSPNLLRTSHSSSSLPTNSQTFPNSPHAPEASSKHSLTIAHASPSHTTPPKLPKENGCMYVCMCLRMYAYMVYVCMSQEAYVCTWAPGGLCTLFKCAAAAASSDQATHDQIAVSSEESCNRLYQRFFLCTAVGSRKLLVVVDIIPKTCEHYLVSFPSKLTQCKCFSSGNGNNPKLELTSCCPD